MRNKIPCSAERLSLLDPQMIRAISDASAFQIAQQYVTENRVRIVEADDAQITSAIIGNSGLYEQTIRLKDGHLLSKCSCKVSEEPMCRHCIAILLEYHRWAQPKPAQQPSLAKESPSSTQVTAFVNGNGTTRESSVADMKLSDVIGFMEWLPSATRAIQAQGQLPDPPHCDSAEVSTWVHTIRTLVDSRRESDQVATRLKAEMRDREGHMQRLTQELHLSMDEMKAAQMTAEELHLRLATYKETLDKLVELATDIVKSDEQMRSAAKDLLEKGSQFDKLANSVKELSQTLRPTAKPPLQDP